ncbi:MAG: aldo/keto reductase [Kibdelosporangium sp.]
MRKRTLPNSGLAVSRLGLGTSTWGLPGTDDDAAAQLRLFADAGGTLIETANVYGDGGSEDVIGRQLSTVFRRADFVIATKAGLVPGKPPLRTDASCSAMLSELESSLRRLRTDYVDLWQVHAWDWRMPVEETLSAFDKAVSAGKARAVGCCNYCGWQTAKAATIQQTRGRTPLATVEVEYSLLQRGIEREVGPASAEFGLGILPWAPLGRGVLTGKYRYGIPAARRDSAFFRWYVEKYATDERRALIVDEVLRCAGELGVTPAVVALCWVRDRPGVIAPLVGARTVDQLAGSLPAELFELPEEIRARLDAVSATPITYPEHRLDQRSTG